MANSWPGATVTRAWTAQIDRYDSSNMMLFIAYGRNYTLRTHPKGFRSRADDYVLLVYKFRIDRQ